MYYNLKIDKLLNEKEILENSFKQTSQSVDEIILHQNIKQLLLQNYAPSNNKKDFVKLTDIKALLKEHGIPKNDANVLQEIAQSIFPKSAFKATSTIYSKQIRNFFTCLKIQ